MHPLIQKLSLKPGYNFFLVPLFVLFILRLAGFDGMTGQDSYAYVDYAKKIVEGIKTGTHPGDFFWPAGYPLLGVLLKPLIPFMDLSLQLIGVISLALTLHLIYKLLIQLHGPEQKNSPLAYLFIFGLFTPYFLRQSLLTMSDLPAAGIFTGGIYYTRYYVQNGQLKHLSLAVLCFFYSAFIRFPAGVIALPFLLWLIFSWVKHGHPFKQLIVLLIPLGIGALYFFFKEGSVFLTDRSWSINYLFTTVFQTREGIIKTTFPNIIMVFSPFAHYGFMLPGFIFILLGLKEIRTNQLLWLIAASYLLYALFIGSYEGQQKRHLIMAFPLVLILCFAGFNLVITKISAHYRSVLFILLLGVQLILSLLSFQGVYSRSKLERTITKDLFTRFKTANQDIILYSFDIDVALKSRGVPMDFYNFWMQDFNEFIAGAYVLFNEHQLKGQWKGTRVMHNWENLKAWHHLTVVTEYPGQWSLYQIGPGKIKE